ncbi:hypothetical protein FGRMN_9509 [Fusarium graminum]|nr:hypothetical protein FGRMN_9509 [Fusarium graminum]
MLRPTDSTMPIGIGFLLLSFGAQFSFAVPHKPYALNERVFNIYTTATDLYIPTNTTAAVGPALPEATTNVESVIVDTTTDNYAPVADPTTIGEIADTTTGAAIRPVNGTTTAIGDIVVTTTNNNVPDAGTHTTMDHSVDTTTNTEVAPIGTEKSTIIDPVIITGVPINNSVSTGTSQWMPPQGTENPTDVVGASNPGIVANTELPPAGNTTMVSEPVIDTTTDILPVDPTTGIVKPLNTTRDAPVFGPETTTTSVVSEPLNTTTDLPVTTHTTVGEPVDTTVNTEVPPSNTDTQVTVSQTTTNNKEDTPNTTAHGDETSKTTDKASEATETKGNSKPSSPITTPPQNPTVAADVAQATASEVNSQVDKIIPIIVAWTNNPVGLQGETLSQVSNLINGVKDSITSIGGTQSSGCPGKRKRGVFDIFTGIVNSMSCVVSTLEDVGGKITGGVVTGVEPLVGTLTTTNQDLKEQSKEKEEEKKSKQEEKSKTEEKESKTEESKTEASTTEKPTSTEAETSTTTETTTTSGLCLMPEYTNIPADAGSQPRNPGSPPGSKGIATATDGSDVNRTSNTGFLTSTAAVNGTTTDILETTTDKQDITAQETSTDALHTTADVAETTTDKQETAQRTSSTDISETTTTQDDSSPETSTHVVPETSAPVTTEPSTFLTTTRPSSDEATTTVPSRTYPCNIYGGPSVKDPYCQCSTTVSGKQYIATAPLIDRKCEAYTEFPSKVDPTTEAPPPTQAPIEKPLTKTLDGTVLVWSAYTLAWGQVYQDVTVTLSNGIGEPKTIETPAPTHTAVDDEGTGQCGTSDVDSKTGLRRACEGAIAHFGDDTIYKGYTTRYDRSSKGLLALFSAFQAGCIVKFSCDDYGIGMSGRLIKKAREDAMLKRGFGLCGHIKLSNSCSIVVDYFLELASSELCPRKAWETFNKSLYD